MLCSTWAAQGVTLTSSQSKQLTVGQYSKRQLLAAQSQGNTGSQQYAEPSNSTVQGTCMGSAQRSCVRTIAPKVSCTKPTPHCAHAQSDCGTAHLCFVPQVHHLEDLSFFLIPDARSGAVPAHSQPQAGPHNMNMAEWLLPTAAAGLLAVGQQLLCTLADMQAGCAGCAHLATFSTRGLCCALALAERGSSHAMRMRPARLKQRQCASPGTRQQARAGQV